MKTLNLTILLLIANALFSQDKIYFDSDWELCKERKAVYYRIVDQISDSKYNVTDFFISGQTQMSGSFSDLKNEIKEGEFKWYYENGHVKSKAEYLDNKIQGIKTTWNITQDTIDIIPYSNGLTDGIWVVLNQDGDTIETRSYKDDNLEGDNYVYHSNGNIQSYGVHKNDYREGKWSYWHQNGNLEMEINYIKGKFNGPFSIFNENGQMEIQKYYVEDSSIFITFLRDNNGVIQKFEPTESPTTGVFYTYYSGSKIQLKYELEEFIPNGDYISYYINGVIESQGKIENGYTIGKWFVFDQNGSLVKTIYFDETNKIKIEQ